MIRLPQSFIRVPGRLEIIQINTIKPNQELSELSGVNIPSGGTLTFMTGSGWGFTEVENQCQRFLSKTRNRIVAPVEVQFEGLREQNNPDHLPPNNYIPERTLMTNHLAGSSACPGDSGGMITLTDPK